MEMGEPLWKGKKGTSLGSIRNTSCKAADVFLHDHLVLWEKCTHTHYGIYQTCIYSYGYRYTSWLNCHCWPGSISMCGTVDGPLAIWLGFYVCSMWCGHTYVLYAWSLTYRGWRTPSVLYSFRYLLCSLLLVLFVFLINSELFFW
jgi:hypothetical protein